MVHDGPLRRSLGLRFAGAIDTLRAGCRQRRHFGQLFHVFLVAGGLRHLVQFRHRLLYRIFQLHIQFTTSRKIGEERENRTVRQMITSDRTCGLDRSE